MENIRQSKCINGEKTAGGTESLRRRQVRVLLYFLKSVSTCLEEEKNKKAFQQHHLFILFLIPTYLILMRPFRQVLREFLKQFSFFFFLVVAFLFVCLGFYCLFFCWVFFILLLDSEAASISMTWASTFQWRDFVLEMWWVLLHPYGSFYYTDSIIICLSFPIFWQYKKTKLVTARMNTWRSNKRIRLFIWLSIVNIYRQQYYLLLISL